MTDTPYQRVHVVINPASGRDEPILNTLNDVFHQYGVDWDVSITKKYGDAATQAKAALAGGADLVVGYGGDGTQHEIANAVLEAADAHGTPARMGILPGGTGNGFARELAVPGKLREAVEVLCASTRTRSIDVGRLRNVGVAKVPLGAIALTECQMVNQFKGSATEAPCFTRGYGLAFGQSERKTMSMALVDRALRARELGEEVAAPAQDEEFVMSHSDNVQATGFVEHLKLPHYVDFQSELGLLRKLRKEFEQADRLPDLREAAE